jgi:cyclic beta-1,2-glucan synthetase
VYQVEPFVIAADVYGAPPHVGRGGWTWYTGSAGWMYRVALESVLGFGVQEGRRLTLKPCIPDDWPGFTLDYRVPGRSTHYAIDVRNPKGNSECVVSATLDGVAVPVRDGVAEFPLDRADITHHIVVHLGPRE